MTKGESAPYNPVDHLYDALVEARNWDVVIAIAGGVFSFIAAESGLPVAALVSFATAFVAVSQAYRNQKIANGVVLSKNG